MPNKLEQIQLFEVKLKKHRHNTIMDMFHRLLLGILYVVDTANEFCSSLLFSIIITCPVFLILSIRWIINRKKIFRTRQIFGRGARILTLHLFNCQSWLLMHSSLFPYVMAGKLALVGISFRECNSIDIDRGDAWLLQFKPGIFNLHFIRSSSKVAFSNQKSDDWEYLVQKRGLSDLVILLWTIPALLYHQGTSTTGDYVEIFGIKMQNVTMIEALSLIDKTILEEAMERFFFVNPDCLNKVFVDKDYYQILKDTRYIFPDGIGINLAGKMLGTPVRENVNGTDMLPLLCELAQKRGYRLYLLGAGRGVAEQMKQKLLLSYPRLNVCGVRDGFFDRTTETDLVVSDINRAEPDILLVAFGAPLQEKFITQRFNEINAKVQMGVGGLFDFYSGNIRRAPVWMRQIGMEWVFRLLQEPKRMWKRYIIGNPLFLYRVFRWKLRK